MSKADDRKDESRRLEAALDQIRKFHAAGRASLKDHPDRIAYGQGAVAKVDGLAGEMLRKARAFADPRIGYTEGEVERLIAACEAAGFVIGVSHVIKLISVTAPDGRADRRQRLALQTAAIRERWPRRRLEEEIRHRIGARRPLAGRRVRPPRDTEDALYKLSHFCGQWRRLVDAIIPAAANDTREQRILPAKISLAVQAVDSAIRKLDATVSKPGSVSPVKPVATRL